jgi:hypothetical protein
VIDENQSQKVLKIDGPFAVVFNEEKMMYLVYNFEEEKFYEWKIED